MRTRLFLRTEFWQRKVTHTAHKHPRVEAEAENRQMLDHRMPTIRKLYGVACCCKPQKGGGERSPRLLIRACIEAFDARWQSIAREHRISSDKTSRAFDYEVHGKGWRWIMFGNIIKGVSTRLIGGLIGARVMMMVWYCLQSSTHSRGDRSDFQIGWWAEQSVWVCEANHSQPAQERFCCKIDTRDTHKPGFKFAEYWEERAAMRLAVGPRDIDAGTIEPRPQRRKRKSGEGIWSVEYIPTPWMKSKAEYSIEGVELPHNGPFRPVWWIQESAR